MELSEEEKKAIEYLDKYTKWETFAERNLEKDIKTTLNFIKKQQKEIEELKKYNKKLSTCHIIYTGITGVDFLADD